mgnify:CR=1 FL=1
MQPTKDPNGWGLHKKQIPLKEGINIIDVETPANAYISYFTEDAGKAPKIPVHFVTGKANGYFDTDDNPDARYALRQALNAQRTADYKAGTYQRAGGVVDPVPEDAPFFVKDYHDYYKTPRGYHPRSLNSTVGWNVTSPLPLLNAKLLAYADEIRSAVLVIHGDKAHSCYFSRDAFARLQGGNKELLLIPGAVHTDLYDRMDIIPFDRIEAFYRQYLK